LHWDHAAYWEWQQIKICFFFMCYSWRGTKIFLVHSNNSFPTRQHIAKQCIRQKYCENKQIRTLLRLQNLLLRLNSEKLKKNIIWFEALAQGKRHICRH
jgi:hypothetical protein